MAGYGRLKMKCALSFRWYTIMYGITTHIPQYNKKWYDSTDVIASISKVTYDIVNNVSPNTENHYVPTCCASMTFLKNYRKKTLLGSR